jgi:chromosome partitioning protein
MADKKKRRVGATAKSKTKSKKEIKPTTSFWDLRFNILQLSEFTGVPRANIYKLIADKVIEGERVQYGATTKQMFSWNDLKLVIQSKYFENGCSKNLQIKVFANLKGGTGKSSTSSQFAMTAAAMGHRVLLIDLDPQAQASLALGFDNLEDDIPTIYNCLGERPGSPDYLPVKKCIQFVTPFLSLIRASFDLSQLDFKLQTSRFGVTKLAEILDSIRNEFDLIVIDTNPSGSISNIHALMSADEICVIAETDYMSVAGLRQFFKLLNELQTDFGDDFTPFVRVIANKFDMREAIAQEALGSLRKNYGDQLANVVVRKNVDLKEAQKRSMPIWAYNKRSSASKDLLALTNELLDESVLES